MQLSVIIINYNVKYFLEQCLCSVYKACSNIDAEIIVFDNNSTDGSQQFFADRFSKVSFTWSQENLGFGRANNEALKLAGGEFVLFLNPDTIVPEDCFEKCLQQLSDQPAAGALGVKMLDGSGNYLKESKRAFPSPFTALYRLTGLAGLFPHSAVFARYYLGNLDKNKSNEIDVLAGAFMMVRKKVLDITGGFDEAFFMYGEDVDLSYRIQEAGFKNLYFPDTSILHFKGESTKKGSLNYVKMFYGAMSLFVKKHYSGGIADVYNIVIRLAIWSKAFLSGIKQFFSTPFKPAFKDFSNLPCIIVADKDEYEMLAALLLKANKQKRVIGRISTGEDIEAGALGNLKQLRSTSVYKEAGEIIFCTNRLSFKEILAYIEGAKPGVIYRFHLQGSSGIVGSESKNSPGGYIAFDTTKHISTK